ncbi:hypothetical protein [Lactobacillus sp. CBA3605]|nr:hypothetical protein [Lactobacillus sp. CBA3605]
MMYHIEDIATKLYMSARTVKRWYAKGVELITLLADYESANN